MLPQTFRRGHTWSGANPVLHRGQVPCLPSWHAVLLQPPHLGKSAYLGGFIGFICLANSTTYPMLRESESIKFTLTNTNQDCLDTLRIKRSLGQRVKGVNTNLAEQVFAWFKNYAPVINEMRENRRGIDFYFFGSQRGTMMHSYMAAPHIFAPSPTASPRRQANRTIAPRTRRLQRERR